MQLNGYRLTLEAGSTAGDRFGQEGPNRETRLGAIPCQWPLLLGLANTHPTGRDRPAPNQGDVKEKSQIDEMRAVIEGDRRRALARLRAEGREPLFPLRPLEEPAPEQLLRDELSAGDPPAEQAGVEVPLPERASEAERGEKPLADELAANDAGNGVELAPGEPPAEPAAVEMPLREPAAEADRGEKPLADEPAANDAGEKLPPEPSRLARLRAIFRRT